MRLFSTVKYWLSIDKICLVFAFSTVISLSFLCGLFYCEQNISLSGDNKIENLGIFDPILFFLMGNKVPKIEEMPSFPFPVAWLALGLAWSTFVFLTLTSHLKNKDITVALGLSTRRRYFFSCLLYAFIALIAAAFLSYLAYLAPFIPYLSLQTFSTHTLPILGLEKSPSDPLVFHWQIIVLLALFITTITTLIFSLRMAFESLSALVISLILLIGSVFSDFPIFIYRQFMLLRMKEWDPNYQSLNFSIIVTVIENIIFLLIAYYLFLRRDILTRSHDD